MGRDLACIRGSLPSSHHVRQARGDFMLLANFASKAIPDIALCHDDIRGLVPYSAHIGIDICV